MKIRWTPKSGTSSDLEWVKANDPESIDTINQLMLEREEDLREMERMIAEGEEDIREGRVFDADVVLARYENWGQSHAR